MLCHAVGHSMTDRALNAAPPPSAHALDGTVLFCRHKPFWYSKLNFKKKHDRA